VALVLLGIAIAIACDVMGKVEFKHPLGLSALGMVAFFAGWRWQQAARPR
jgi:hypothetical protein